MKNSALRKFILSRRIMTACLLAGLLLIICTHAFAGQGTADFGYNSDLDLTDKYANQFRIRRSFGDISYGSYSLGLKWDISFFHCMPDGVLSYGTDKSGETQPGGDWIQAKIPFKNEFSQLHFGVEAIPEFLYLGSAWRFETERRQDLTAMAEISPVEFVRIKGEWGRKYPLPAFADLLYYYVDDDGTVEHEGGRIDLSMPAMIQNISITLRTLPDLKVEFTDRTSRFSPGNFEPGNSYHMMLDGIYRDGRIQVEYLYKTRNKVVVEYRHGRARMSLETFYMGESFGYFGIANGDYDLAALRVISSKWKASVQAGHASGDLAGSVNSWPFVDGLLMFLGERRQFIGEAGLKWLTSSLESKIHESRRWSLTGIVDYLSLKPRANYKSWRPLLWGFGVDDMRTDQLTVSRADLLRLKINPSLSISRWTLNLSVSQWVPLYVKKYSSGSHGNASDTGGQSDESAGFQNESSHGGFAASFNISVKI